MGTGGAIRVCSPGLSSGSGKAGVSRAVGLWRGSEDVGRGGASGAEHGIRAAKGLAVSAGGLRRYPAVHLRPIDLVVCEEPVALRPGDLILEGVSRLDAFSVYPFRTLATLRCHERDNRHTRGTSLPILSY